MFARLPDFHWRTPEIFERPQDFHLRRPQIFLGDPKLGFKNKNWGLKKMKIFVSQMKIGDLKRKVWDL